MCNWTEYLISSLPKDIRS